MSLQIQLKKSAVSQKQPFASDLAVGELALNYNADGPFLTCKDTAGNVRKLNNVWVAATAPNSPSAGDLWLDTSSATPVLKAYKDSTTTWVGATSVPLATTTVFGTVRLASAADVTNGTSGKVVDAAQLQSKITDLLSNDVTLNGDLEVNGDLTVNGTTTTVSSETLLVEDKNIEMGVVATPTNTTADGGGITLRGATNKTINWVNATGAWTSSERFSYPLGTAAAPTLTFTGDPNTGIYSPGADQVAVATNGTGRLFVASNGRVGIGLASPESNLQVRGSNNGTHILVDSATASDYTFLNAKNASGVDVQLAANGNDSARVVVTSNHPLAFFTNGSERLRITSAGLVGIGTSSPDELLHIEGDTAEFKGTNTNPIGDTGGTEQVFKFGIEGQKNAVFGPAGSIIFRQDGSTWSSVDPNNKPTRIEFCTQDGSGLDTSDTPRLVVNQDGLVGIGTTSPGSLLSIEQAGTAEYMRITSSDAAANGDRTVTISARKAGVGYHNLELESNALIVDIQGTERARIDSSGRLLVGTSTARENFFNSSFTAGLQLEGLVSNTATVSIITNRNEVGNVPCLLLGKTRGTTVGSNTIVQNNDIVGFVTFQAADGTHFVETARIEAEIDGTPGADDMPGRLVFSTTADGSSSPTERMRIDSQGRVGIGGTPSAPLHIQRPAGTATQLLIETGDGTAAAQVSYRQVGAVQWDVGPVATTGNLTTAINGGQTAYEITRSGTSVFAHLFSTNGSERARIDSSGRLLVGTSNGISRLTLDSGTDGGGATAQEGAIRVIARRTGSPYGLLLEHRNPDETATSDGRGLQIGFLGYNGTSVNVLATIAAAADGQAVASGDGPGRLVFSVTADGASSPTEAMRIKNSRILNFANTPTYADNTAAKAGGLVDGDVYRKSDGTLMIVYT